MNFKSQEESINKLHSLAKTDRHSVLIEGVEGCGKTYLGKIYGTLLKIDDIVSVQPTVNEIKTMLEECYRRDNPIVVIIENLDKGVKGASYAMLKFLEEPRSNVYLVVTCRNLTGVPDTILSRCTQVSVAPPIDVDIDTYSRNRDEAKYMFLRSKGIWKCVRSFNDVDTLLKLTTDEVFFFEDTLATMNFKRDPVSTTIWNISHFKDGSEAPLTLVVRYLLTKTTNKYLQNVCIDVLKELNYSRLSSHAILAKLVFEFKYGGD